MEQNKETKENEIGTISGIFIITFLFVLGGFYFLGQRITEEKHYEALREQNAASSSDDINNIAQDAAALDFQNLGKGVNNLK